MSAKLCEVKHSFRIIVSGRLVHCQQTLFSFLYRHFGRSSLGKIYRKVVRVQGALKIGETRKSKVEVKLLFCYTLEIAGLYYFTVAEVRVP